LEAFVSNGRALKQAAGGSPPAQNDETEEIDCNEVILGADVDLGGGRVLRSLTTSTITECCEECQSMEGCTTFRRSRSSGSCELLNVEATRFQINSNSDFDIGGFVLTESILKSSGVLPPSPPPDCKINQGVTYPKGDILSRGNGRSANHCCEVCRASSECNSWYYKRENNRCTLNRNIPSAVEEDASSFKGGSSRD